MVAIGGKLFQFVFCDVFIGSPACAGEHPSGGGNKFFATAANPRAKSSGVADHQGVIWNTASDYRSSSDHRPSADRQVGKHCAIRTDAATFLEMCFEFCEVAFAARPKVIREHGSRPDEDVIFYGDSIPKINAALKSHTISQTNVALDECMVADITVLSDGCAGDHMGKCPDSRSLADRNAFINQRPWVGKMATRLMTVKNDRWRGCGLLRFHNSGKVVITKRGEGDVSMEVTVSHQLAEMFGFQICMTHPCRVNRATFWCYGV